MLWGGNRKALCFAAWHQYASQRCAKTRRLAHALAHWSSSYHGRVRAAPCVLCACLHACLHACLPAMTRAINRSSAPKLPESLPCCQATTLSSRQRNNNN